MTDDAKFWSYIRHGEVVITPEAMERISKVSEDFWGRMNGLKPQIIGGPGPDLDQDKVERISDDVVEFTCRHCCGTIFSEDTPECCGAKMTRTE